MGEWSRTKQGGVPSIAQIYLQNLVLSCPIPILSYHHQQPQHYDYQTPRNKQTITYHPPRKYDTTNKKKENPTPNLKHQDSKKNSACFLFEDEDTPLLFASRYPRAEQNNEDILLLPTLEFLDFYSIFFMIVIFLQKG